MEQSEKENLYPSWVEAEDLKPKTNFLENKINKISKGTKYDNLGTS